MEEDPNQEDGHKKKVIEVAFASKIHNVSMYTIYIKWNKIRKKLFYFAILTFMFQKSENILNSLG